MMQSFIAKIGKGAKTCKDLTWEEAKQAMACLVEGRATEAQIGAFLIGMRMKGESVGEFAAFTATARSYVTPLRVPDNAHLVDVACYAGKQDTFSAIAGAALVAASAGATVLVHGWEGLPERPGVWSTFSALGIAVDLPPSVVEKELVANAFAYLDIALFHPPLGKLLALRHELGVRNFVHPVARMLNPARAAVQVIGMMHPPYFEKIGEALGMLGGARALIVRGVEGEPELSIAGGTQITELRDRDGHPMRITFQPKDAGLPLGTTRDMAGFSPKERNKEAALLLRILQGELKGQARNWITLNAGMLLYAARVAASIPEGVRAAQTAIDSGAVMRKLMIVGRPAGIAVGSTL
ncbi:anthranilate phosphoribosyltransferase [Nitrospira sp.]|nr:anthranilate phosphoribosyltransferase [Nitrospira sp.]